MWADLLRVLRAASLFPLGMTLAPNFTCAVPPFSRTLATFASRLLSLTYDFGTSEGGVPLLGVTAHACASDFSSIYGVTIGAIEALGSHKQRFVEGWLTVVMGRMDIKLRQHVGSFCRRTSIAPRRLEASVISHADMQRITSWNAAEAAAAAAVAEEQDADVAAADFVEPEVVVVEGEGE